MRAESDNDGQTTSGDTVRMEVEGGEKEKGEHTLTGTGTSVHVLWE
jgi:hypothetical protein